MSPEQAGMLSGRAIVVTGAGGGLGHAYAEDLARAGASVLVSDIDGDAAAHVATEIGALGGVAVADCHTVADPQQAAEIIDHAITTFGRLDGLVNNAGVFYVADPEGDDPLEATEMVAVNLLGTLYSGCEPSATWWRTAAGSSSTTRAVPNRG